MIGTLETDMTSSSSAGAPPRSLESFKRRAKALARSENIPLQQAQERLAVEYGFTSYRHARRALENPRTAQPAERPTRQDPQDSQTPLSPSRQELLDSSRRDFARALGDFPDGTSDPLEDVGEIVSFLNRVLSSASTYCFLPHMGGLRFTGARRGPEPGTIALMMGGDGLRICKPDFLEVNYIQESPGESVILLHLDRLPVTGVYEEERAAWCEERGQEELAIGPDGTYYEREVFDDREIEDVRLLVRFLSGKMLFAATGGFWNGLRMADSGLHEKMGIEEIGSLIRGLIDRFGTRTR